MKGEILGGLPPITPGEFDNFEVHGMRFLGKRGDYDDAEPTDVRPDFWTLFGHYAPEMAHRDRGMQGLQSIMDYDSEATANAVAAELITLYAAKRFGGMQEDVEDLKGEIIHARNPRIRVAYEKNPVGDEEEGERGWIEEEGVELVPDEFERAEDKSYADLAINYLEGERGDGMYPSSSHFHHGIWYSTRYDGARHDYFLVDFSEEEERAVYDAMTS